MSDLNSTPSANRLHIGIFGRTNSGKSSFINALTNQDISIVSDIAGTTTDPVHKAMEIYPIGPCEIIDTAGICDESGLSDLRDEKTMLMAKKCDIAIMLVSDDAKFGKETIEYQWYLKFKKLNTPVIFVINKVDITTEELAAKRESNIKRIYDLTGQNAVSVSAKYKTGIDEIKEALMRNIPEGYGQTDLLGDYVGKEDLVLLVMPQDIQAPKGRLILPQVQTIRELLDKKCIVVSVTTEQLLVGLKTLCKPPKLIITDSQVFDYVYEHKPEESKLTSFSILFAALKGDLEYYVNSVEAIANLTKDSKILIAECCTHAPLSEDIGREKIPAMLRKRFGTDIKIDIVSGTDFPKDLAGYDLIIQCGGCMFNRKYVTSRIDAAKADGVPMTNYGVFIAKMKGILDKIEIMQ